MPTRYMRTLSSVSLSCTSITAASMPLYLCADCGGSKTSVVICDEHGTVLGRAFGGPSNFAYLSVEAFTSAVSLTISDALKTCITPPSVDPVSLPPIPGLIEAAWFGVSGVDSDSALSTITKVLSSLLALPVGPKLLVGNDTQLLAAPLRIHLELSSVVTVVAGTGSIAVSFESVNGELKELGRAGGWGWILGDAGGGFHVGQEAVRQVLREGDKASVTASPLFHSPFITSILNAFSVTEVPEILSALYVADPHPSSARVDGPPHTQIPREKRLSSLAPLVFKAAFDDSDPLALNILRTAAEAIASEIALLLGERNDVSTKVFKAQSSLISFGGSLAGVPAYRQFILDALANWGHIFAAVEFVDDAATVGAKGLATSFKTAIP